MMSIAAPPPGFIEIAVVGAHLSGMPLNGELTSRGGVFLRSGTTEASYTLSALPGGPPKRPGLLRVAAGAGHAITIEVWALPPEGFGTFVAGIPAPLSIGTLRLADGTTPKGFLVEPEGLKGATDISHYGGWRAFIASQATATTTSAA
jgi:allophanate hydrolase